jgi:hypothetical protein
MPSVFLISVDNFPLFSKDAEYLSYQWVIFLHSQKAFSVYHILLCNFSLISKGAQSPFENIGTLPNIWEILSTFWEYRKNTQHMTNTGSLLRIWKKYPTYEKYWAPFKEKSPNNKWEILSAFCTQEKISYTGYFSLFSKCAQYFSYRWIIFLYFQKMLSIYHISG